MYRSSNFKKLAGLSFNLYLAFALFTPTFTTPSSSLNPSTAHSTASPGEKMALAGFFPPAMNALDVQGSYAYVGAGASLLVIDVSNPDSPRRVAYRLLPAGVMKVVATTGRVYVLTNAGQVQIFDISQPPSPNLIGAYTSAQNPTYLDASGERFYLNGDDGLSILDASSPEAIVLVGALPVTYDIQAFKVVGDHAVIVTCTFPVAAQILVADLSDPTHPTLIGQGLNFPSSIVGVTNLVVSGNMAAVALTFLDYGLYDLPGVYLIDLTDPAHPALTKAISWGPYNNYVAVALQDHYLYSSSMNEGITIYDISDPTTPLELGSAPTKTQNFAVVGNRIYIAAGGDGFAIYDVDASGNPTPRGALPGIGLPRDVAVNGDNLFVADGGVPQYLYDMSFGGLSILNAQRLDEIKVIGKEPLSSPGTQITLEQDRAYLTWGNCNYDRYGSCPRGISTFDITDPGSVDTLQSFDLPINSTQSGPVVVRNRVAYVANTANGLSILDFGNTAGPSLLGSYPESATGVAITGTYALVSSQTYLGAAKPSLQVVDVSNPMTPTALAEYDMSDPHQVTLGGSLAFLADGIAGLKVLDISYLPQVTVLGTLNTPGTAMDVAYDGHYAYLADGENGLHMIDVSDPSHPLEVDAFITAGRASNVAVAGDQIYLADESGGLLVFSLVKPQSYLTLLMH